MSVPIAFRVYERFRSLPALRMLPRGVADTLPGFGVNFNAWDDATLGDLETVFEVAPREAQLVMWQYIGMHPDFIGAFDEVTGNGV